MTGVIRIAEESALQPDMDALIGELNIAIREMEPQTPDEFNFCMTAGEMARPDTTVWIARSGEEALGCCALRRHDGGLGEIKRMYVRPAARGLRLGALLLREVEARAVSDGLDRLALETGADYDAARRVYEAAGFERTGPFADYPDNPYSIFYAKQLAQSHDAPRVS